MDEPTPQLICNICAEKYNKTTRKLIECEYCHYAACRQCCQTYLLSDGVSFPTCMRPNSECGREWTRKFCAASFTGIFLNKTYKKHCEQLLYDRELALMPATQVIVEQLMEQERLTREISEVKLQIRRLNAREADLRDQRNQIGRNTHRENRAVFTRACPDPDCRGFLSTQWKCGLCHQWSCPECSEVKGLARDAPHECNPDNVASTALMRQDTKPCPTCGMGIFRISGCSQLWCTQCHTAFCWNTGQIETRHVHNPHYFEWMRLQQSNGGAGVGAGHLPRDPFDIPCGRELCTIFVRRIMKLLEKHKIPADINKHLVRTVRQVIHLNRVVVPMYRTDAADNNRGLRIRYLRKCIDEAEFKKLLQLNHKKNSKKRDIMDVLQMMVVTCTDILHRLREELMKDVPEEVGTEEVDPNQAYHDYQRHMNEVYERVHTAANQTTDPVPRMRLINMDEHVSSISVPLSEEVVIDRNVRHYTAICTQYTEEIRLLVKYANDCLQEIGATYGCRPMCFDKNIDLVYAALTTTRTTENVDV